MIAADLRSDLDAFRLHVRDWLAQNLERSTGGGVTDGRAERTDEEAIEQTERARRLQRKLYDAGLAGLCVPEEYGGQGLPHTHQRVFNEEIDGFEMPSLLQVPTMVPCMAVLLDFGTEEQKRQHVPAILRGEEIWVQMLSEPSGGSDVAGALTTATRDGEEWVLSGSKVWTSGAWRSDWGLLLARTNWDAPKHRGLTVFMVKIGQPGLEICRIEMLNGARDFCQEFFNDVRIPDSARIGEVDAGWTVGTRWMFHERIAKFGGSLYISRPITHSPGDRTTGGVGMNMLRLARRAGTLETRDGRRLVGEAHALSLVGRELSLRLAEGIASGALAPQAAAIGRVYSGDMEVRNATIGFRLAGPSAVAWDESDGELGDRGVAFLMRQRHCIGGGTIEMGRNAVSEQVLGFPREARADLDRAFRDVRTNSSSI